MKSHDIDKEVIIAEYLTRDCTLRQLAIKYGISFHTIHNWVTKFNRKDLVGQETIEQAKLKIVLQESLPTEVKQLQSELRKAKLNSMVMEEMLKLSEELTGIDIRKKVGTKQSCK